MEHYHHCKRDLKLLKKADIKNAKQIRNVAEQINLKNHTSQKNVVIELKDKTKETRENINGAIAVVDKQKSVYNVYGSTFTHL
jgi:hypothetical protein